jgi:C4-dicarboxylate transporter DctM subunit
MSPTIIGIIGIAVLVVLIFAGMNIGLAMLTVGFVGFAAVVGRTAAFGILETVPYSTSATYALAVIPLFVFMGELAFVSGMSGGLYNAGRKLLARLPGGLCCATIAACAGFAAICGSSAATAATLGTVALPEMKESGYKDSLATGTLAAGGTIGILIPPSTGFIVYGIISETSIGRLFAAGVIPGILLALLMIVTVVISVKLRPELAPPLPGSTWKEKLGSLPGLLPVLLLFAFVIGGMFGGLFTATEAAGVGAFVSFCTWQPGCGSRGTPWSGSSRTR